MVETFFSVAPYRLLFRTPFETAHGRRDGTDAVFVQLKAGSLAAFGEATLPPYLPYDSVAVIRWLTTHIPASFVWPDNPAGWLRQLPSDCPPALAAVDMALWQLYARITHQSVAAILGMGARPGRVVPHTYTIGVDRAAYMRERVEVGLRDGFTHFKLKLNGHTDREVVCAFRAVSDAPFAVDVNQGWREPEQAAEMVRWLEQQGCFLVEQPFLKSKDRWMEPLRGLTTLPIIADESCQGLEDLERLSGMADGINIKLQKCGGLAPAARIMLRARELGMKVLIGCMSESSVGCGAAEWLAPWCDWADLDGPWLIRNDPDMNLLFA